MIRFAAFFVALLIFVLPLTPCSAQVISLPNVPTKGYDVHYYNATIWLNKAQNAIAGKVEMTATSLGNLPQILQHAKSLTIDSVFVDGVRAKTQMLDPESGAYAIIGYPENYQNGSEFVVRTFYHGNATNEGGARSWGGVQNKAGMMFAMGVGMNAPYISCTRHWLPCYDEPDDKADSVSLKFFADTSGIVVSNGVQTGYLVKPDRKTTFTEWTVSHKIATYLLTFAFGPFEKISIANPLNIPFDVYGYARDTAKLRRLMQERVVQALVFFDSLIGPYPFEKVGYVVAPIGSMEHQTMITIAATELDPNSMVAVHELSHQWWGDRVTCYDFSDAWLNEGFARYCEALFLERFSGKHEYWKSLRAAGVAGMTADQDSIPLHGAPYYTTPRNNYPPIIYQKGAAVLGMLRYIYGDSAFFAAIRGYGTPFGPASVTSDDLAEAFYQVTHTDVGWFFNKWVWGVGHPVYNVLWSHSKEKVSVRIEQSQDAKRMGFFRMPLIIEARNSKGQVERRKINADSLKLNKIDLITSFEPDTIIVDPEAMLLVEVKQSLKLDGHTTAPSGVEMLNVKCEMEQSNSKTLRVSINGNPAKAALLNDGNSELLFFDRDGNNVATALLEHKLGGGSPQSNDYSYSVDTGALASGTYFATLLLNGTTVGGKSTVVVTK